jgi:hypothetical protein
MSNGIEQWWHGLICRGAAYLNNANSNDAKSRAADLQLLTELRKRK